MPQTRALTGRLRQVPRRAAAIGCLGLLALSGLAGPGAQTSWAQAAPAAASAPAPAPQAAPERLFLRHADVQSAKLAPDGRHLAIAMALRERVALAVVPLAGDMKPRVVAHYADADIAEFYWVDNERLVYDLIDQQRGSGDQFHSAGLFAVNADGSEARTLVKLMYEGIALRAGPGRPPLDYNHELLRVPQDGSGEVLVGRWAWRSNAELSAIVPLRLNTRDGRTRSAAQGAPDGVTGWLFDPQGEARLASGQHEGQRVLHWRAPGTDTWKEIARMPATRQPWSPYAVDGEGQLYVTMPAGPDGAATLRRFDFATGQPQAEPLVSTPGFDFRGRLVTDGPGGRLLGVRAETDAETTVWFDARLKSWQAEADQRLPGRVNRLDCRRCDGDDPLLLVHSWSDRQPGEYWLMRPSRQGGEAATRWQSVGPSRGDVDARRMATVDFFRVPSRDGQKIPLWLTLPAGADRDKRARPAVLWVHGGPWVRGGHWRWDGEQQFLAAQGYVVLQPEYRSSTGYGARWYQAGRKQWGRAMQDDLVDALNWAVAQGHVDPKRVCIAGASYGGYAALMAPLKHPGVFRCSISWVGVTDPRAMMNRWDGWQDFNDETRRYGWPQLVGDPVADSALLDEATPVLHAARWEIPLLMAYGGQDRRVPVAQGEAFRSALRSAGKPEPEWVVYADEGHGWLKPANRYDFARRMAAFLARHLQ